MTEEEKLDIILKKLYEYRNDTKPRNIKEVLFEAGVFVKNTEAYNLAARLIQDGHITGKPLVDRNVIGLINTYGIEFVETDSYTNSGQSILKNNYAIKVKNNDGTKAANQSNTSDFSGLLETLSQIKEAIKADTVVTEKKQLDIIKRVEVIESGIQNGTNPKRDINSLIEVTAKIESVAGLATSLR